MEKKKMVVYVTFQTKMMIEEGSCNCSIFSSFSEFLLVKVHYNNDYPINKGPQYKFSPDKLISCGI